MKIIERRLGCIVGRRWAGGVSIAITVPKVGVRQRILDATYSWLRRHPTVAEYEELANRFRRAIEVLESELDDLDGRHRDDVCLTTQARWDAQAIYDHAQEIVEIIHRYQGSLNTLGAPDPHEARVHAVVDNFFKQFKDRYDRHG